MADISPLATFCRFVENPSCVQIFLACCHDNAYVRMLEKYIHIPAMSTRVTLVKASRVGSGFNGLPFKTTTMDKVFWNPSGSNNGSTSNAANTESGKEQSNEPRFL